MEPGQYNFNLTSEINNWQQSIRTGALTEDDIEELTSHLYDEIEDLQSKGLSDEEAFMIALKRIGHTKEIEDEYDKLNLSFSNGYNLLMLFWGASIFMLMQTVLFVGPNLPRLIKSKRDHIWYLLDIDLTRTLSYCFCVMVGALTVFNIVKPDKVSAMFSNLIAKYSVVAAFFSFFIGVCASWYNYSSINSNTAIDFFNKQESMLSVQLLATIFYGSVISLTAWLTLRYQKKKFRNIKIFSANLHWLSSLLLGIILTWIVNASHMAISTPLTFGTIIVCFSIGGYLVGRSKNFVLNLAMLQLYSACEYLIISILNTQAHFLFAFEYAFVIISILLGSSISRKKIRDA